MKRFFFGYGSLVHKGTHDHDNHAPARLQGWKRVWVATPARALPYLSVIRDDDSAIDGLIAEVPDQDWEALDQREAAYQRVPLGPELTHHMDDMPTGSLTVVYSVAPDEQQPVSEKNPILLSYLDVVVQGYFDVFGPAGVDHFFTTTYNWTGSYLDDRASPIYPRAQLCDTGLQAQTDARVKELGQARIMQADFPLW